jgi:hypothetical protein
MISECCCQEISHTYTRVCLCDCHQICQEDITLRFVKLWNRCQGNKAPSATQMTEWLSEKQGEKFQVSQCEAAAVKLTSHGWQRLKNGLNVPRRESQVKYKAYQRRPLPSENINWCKKEIIGFSLKYRCIQGAKWARTRTHQPTLGWLEMEKDGYVSFLGRK